MLVDGRLINLHGLWNLLIFFALSRKTPYTRVKSRYNTIKFFKLKNGLVFEKEG